MLGSPCGRDGRNAADKDDMATAQAAEGPTRKVAVHVARCVCSVRCVSSNGKRSVECTKIYLWNLVASYFLHRLEQHCQALEESLKLYDACATHLTKNNLVDGGQKRRLYLW